jgi:hypothetical protein
MTHTSEPNPVRILVRTPGSTMSNLGVTNESDGCVYVCLLVFVHGYFSTLLVQRLHGVNDLMKSWPPPGIVIALVRRD